MDRIHQQSDMFANTAGKTLKFDYAGFCCSVIRSVKILLPTFITSICIQMVVIRKCYGSFVCITEKNQLAFWRLVFITSEAIFD